MFSLPTASLLEGKIRRRQSGSRTASDQGKHYSNELMGAPASWLGTETDDGGMCKKGLDSGMIPPVGTAIDISLDETPEDEVAIEIMTAAALS